jgi:hypothetical protein
MSGPSGEGTGPSQRYGVSLKTAAQTARQKINWTEDSITQLKDEDIEVVERQMMRTQRLGARVQPSSVASGATCPHANHAMAELQEAGLARCVGRTTMRSFWSWTGRLTGA